MTQPLSIAFNLPFAEAIAAALARKVVLPDVYYGELQGVARQLAFTVSGLAGLEQIQQVKDLLDKALTDGQSFNTWKKAMRQQGFDLPRHRLDNIYRTNLQSQYMAGKWEQFERNRDNRPYLMYDAINDSRVRPAHLALDGKIWHIDDPQLSTHSAPNGYRCRCSMVSLTEAQAQARSGEGKGLNKPLVLPDGITPAEPDKGWDYSPRDRLAGVKRAVENKAGKVAPQLKQALDAKLDDMNKLLEFVPAKTVEEAEKWLVNNDVVDVADFGKIKDVDVVNQWSKALFDGINEFPELRKNQLFTGSCQAQYTRWHKEKTEWYVQEYVKVGRSSSDGEFWAKRKIKKPKVTERWAHSSQREWVSGIAVNEKYTATAKGIDDLNISLKHSVDTAFHPPGCDTLKSIVDHEIGHQIDDLLLLHKDQEVLDLFKSLRNQRTIESEVSGYANENIREFIAEAWSEFKNNPNPRATAAKIGRIIAARYAARFGN